MFVRFQRKLPRQVFGLRKVIVRSEQWTLQETASRHIVIPGRQLRIVAIHRNGFPYDPARPKTPDGLVRIDIIGLGHGPSQLLQLVHHYFSRTLFYRNPSGRAATDVSGTTPEHKMEPVLRILEAAWQRVALELKPLKVVGSSAIERITAMILKCIALLFVAVALAGCCLSGNGCYTSLPGTPIAWDSLGSPPTDSETKPKPKRASRLKNEIVVGPLNETSAQADPKPQSHDRWAEEQAADQDADAKLKQQMKICSNC
jgi:hypothetical protein